MPLRRVGERKDRSIKRGRGYRLSSMPEPFGSCFQVIKRSFMPELPPQKEIILVTKYASRHWAVWMDQELVAVMVYKKGAVRVADLLRNFPQGSQPRLDRESSNR